MMENDDELLQQFFAQHTMEIEDNGFTGQVMRKLPRQPVNLNRIWVSFCVLVGIVFLVFSDAITQLRMVFRNFMGDISGLLASIELGSLSPVMVYLVVLTLVSVGAYNVMTSR